MRKVPKRLCVVFASAILSTTVFAQSPPTEITIDNWGYEKNVKGPVPFPHVHHIDFGFSCDECHHNHTQGDKVQRCKSCHSPTGTDPERYKLQNAYHKNCKDCHEERYKAGLPAGPFKKCNECHIPINGYSDTDHFHVGKNGCNGETPCYASIQEAINASNKVHLVIDIDGDVYDGPIVLNADKEAFLEGNGHTVLRQAPRALQGMVRIRNLTIKP